MVNSVEKVCGIDEHEVSLRDLLCAIWRRRLSFVVIFIILFAVCLAYVLTRQPQYLYQAYVSPVSYVQSGTIQVIGSNEVKDVLSAFFENSVAYRGSGIKVTCGQNQADGCVKPLLSAHLPFGRNAYFQGAVDASVQALNDYQAIDKKAYFEYLNQNIAYIKAEVAQLKQLVEKTPKASVVISSPASYQSVGSDLLTSNRLFVASKASGLKLKLLDYKAQYNTLSGARVLSIEPALKLPSKTVLFVLLGLFVSLILSALYCFVVAFFKQEL